MNREKINHPFQVPEGFFEEFGKEMNSKMDTETRQIKVKLLALTISKYAAIFVFAFILGRASVAYFQNKSQPKENKEIYSVENVLLQVSDADITNYLIENVTDDMSN